MCEGISKEERMLKRAFVILLVFLIGMMTGLFWSYHQQSKGVNKVQLRELTEYPEYDYTVCGGCHLRTTMCKPNDVICGIWIEKIRAARRDNFMAVMREIKPDRPLNREL